MICLKTTAKQINAELSAAVNPNNTTQIKLKINKLTMLLAPAYQALALAQWEYIKVMEQLVLHPDYDGLPQNEKDTLIDGNCYNEIYDLTIAKGQKNALKQTIKSLRAIL